MIVPTISSASLSKPDPGHVRGVGPGASNHGESCYPPALRRLCERPGGIRLAPHTRPRPKPDRAFCRLLEITLPDPGRRSILPLSLVRAIWQPRGFPIPS